MSRERTLREEVAVFAWIATLELVLFHALGVGQQWWPWWNPYGLV